MERPPRDPKLALDAVTSPTASPGELACLARSEHGFVRERVARHPAVTPEILASLVPAALAREEDLYVALALAANGATPAPALTALLYLLDRDRLDGGDRGDRQLERLAVAVCAHPRCPLEPAAELLADRRVVRRVRVEVAKTAGDSELLRPLTGDPGGRVADAAQRRLRALSEVCEGPVVDPARERRLVEAFVLAPRRERLLAMLSQPKRRARALDALNHFHDLDPRFATEVRAEEVLGELRARGAPERCYLVSDINELDACALSLDAALQRVESGGWGTFVDCLPGRLAYYHGELGEQRLILERRRG